MTSLSVTSRARRAQPLLGTLVEVTVWHATQKDAQRACDAAFDAAAAVDAAMSYHREDSDLSRLNRAAPGVTVQVGLDTWAVLTSAARLHRLSGGLFDCTIAPRLETEGFLPRVAHAAAGDRPALADDFAPTEHPATSGRLRASDHPTQADVLLPAACRVRKRRTLRLDLGGIAKGYAVDRAVDALRSAGAAGGLVNAGGDMRVFGPRAVRVDVRDPAAPGCAAARVALKEAALATSGSYFSSRAGQGRCTPIVDPRIDACIDMRYSVTVAARRCVFADALTKVVALSANRHHPALGALRAEAWILGSLEARHA
jgi:thiamine biosynthesis lipoprotein